MKVYSLTEAELEALHDAGNYKSLDIAVFSLAAGVAVTTGITVATVDNLGPKVSQVLWALLFVSLFATVFFGVRSVIAWKSAARRLQDIKRASP